MSRNDTVVARIPKKLVEDINDYANKKYGVKVPFPQAAINYAIDSRDAREALSRRKDNKFL